MARHFPASINRGGWVNWLIFLQVLPNARLELLVLEIYLNLSSISERLVSLGSG
jgi:hypothetical protein